MEFGHLSSCIRDALRDSGNEREATSHVYFYLFIHIPNALSFPCRDDLSPGFVPASRTAGS